jgi:uncharacterized damage-inducible protein DinB
MKYSTKALFLSSLIIFGTQSSATILDQSTIDKKALAIEKRLKQERYLMYGLTTIAVAHEIYQWVPMLKDFFAPQSATAEKKPDLSFFQSIKAGAKHLFYTKEGWVSLIQSGFSMGGIVIISQMGEQYIHPDTLRWYINAHAPYQGTIKLMKEQVNNLQDPSIDLEQQQIHNEMVLLLYDRLVHQATLMCAYMTYKVKYLDKAEYIIGERSKNAMLKVHHKWLHDIEEQLNSADRDYAHIDNILVSYENALTAQANHFALIEGETRRERRAIKKQMKQ